MNTFLSSLRLMILMTLVLGLGYPLLVAVLGWAVFPAKAGGSLIQEQGQTRGSELIGQKFESERYFWGRPSGIDFNPQPSGGTNLGPISPNLKKQIQEREAKMKAAHGPGAVPGELLVASASGVDPEFSRAAARYQIKRVAEARGVPQERVHQLVDRHQQGRQLGFLGEERINVLRLNMALDREFGKGSTP